MAILKVPTTITTTLAATSSERIFEVTEDDPSFAPSLSFSLSFSLAACLAVSLALVFSALARAFSLRGWAAAACAARRAAAMKLEDETGGRGVAGISLIALSEAAMRSEGEAGRAPGRVPGSSG